MISIKTNKVSRAMDLSQIEYQNDVSWPDFSMLEIVQTIHKLKLQFAGMWKDEPKLTSLGGSIT